MFDGGTIVENLASRPFGIHDAAKGNFQVVLSRQGQHRSGGA